MEISFLAGSLLCLRYWIQSFLGISGILNFQAFPLLFHQLSFCTIRFDTLIIIAALVATVANATIQSGQYHGPSASPPPGIMHSIHSLCGTSTGWQ